MVNLNVIGRMVADAEMMTSKNGKQFISGRFAVDDFNNNEKTTAWFRLTIEANDRNVKLLPFLTKGKLLNVIGSEGVNAYLDKEGNPQVSRDIRVSFIDFVNGGSSGETATKSASVETSVPTNCGTFKKPEPTVETAVVASDPEDDLPF